ncbi:MAG TPA: hypothetical protein VGM64_06090 [Lacunisphaera sp.]|jgi:hypothetical protein
MKTIFSAGVILLCLSGCTSKPVASTKEHRGDPARSIAYDNYVSRRTTELQSMGGKLKDHGAATLKAQEEANDLFGGPPGDLVTTTWGPKSKAQIQEEFTDKLDDMDKKKRTD